MDTGHWYTTAHKRIAAGAGKRSTLEKAYNAEGSLLIALADRHDLGECICIDSMMFRCVDPVCAYTEELADALSDGLL
jgi:hypothetical protein